MDLTSFASAATVHILIGKGGVGKTTTTAAFATACAAQGLRVLIIELENRPDLGVSFGHEEPLGYDEVHLLDHRTGGSVHARAISPDDALVEYLNDHGFLRLTRRLISTGLLDVIAGSIPGLRDVLVLGKIKQIAADNIADVIVVDAPATGHAMTFLTSAAGLMDVARSGPVRAQAASVVEMLTDPSRCRVLLVTLAEELPVSEAIEAAFLVEDKAGVSLGPVIVNQVDIATPVLHRSSLDAAHDQGITIDAEFALALDAAAAFQLQRVSIAREQLDRLRHELPLPVLELPRLLSPAIGSDEREVLARVLTEEFETMEGLLP